MRNYLLNEYYWIEQAQQNQTILIAEIIIGIILIVAMWRLFDRAGEPGWNAIIPIYDVYKLFKIATGNGWLCVLLLFPILRVIGEVILGLNLAKAFGKSSIFALGLAIFPIVFIPILAFSDPKYIGPRGWGNFGGFNASGYNSSREEQRQTKATNVQSDGLDEFNESEAQTVDFEVEKTDE